MALGAFGIGALGGGRLGSAMSRRRGALLAATAAVQVVFLAGGVVMAALAGSPVPAEYRYGPIVVLAISMGVQNATARRLAVPDLTTTVLKSPPAANTAKPPPRSRRGPGSETAR